MYIYIDYSGFINSSLSNLSEINYFKDMYMLTHTNMMNMIMVNCLNVAYHPPSASPPPVGYPTQDIPQYPHNSSMVETKSKGDGFWKGW